MLQRAGKISIISTLFFCSTTLSLPAADAARQDIQPEKPKLILQITVDQLRGDLPAKFMKNMGAGGFRYLMENGIWYANAHYRHSNTETVVGHTTLATGAIPAVHGMVSNVWFDRDTGKLAYNIEDDRYHILSAGADVDKATEVDSSQALASTDGRSPANILVSTFSDELTLLTNGKAKIFGVSVKDRGAVTLAGHTGKAFWFSKATGDFITSSYYYEKYPQWVSEWNSQKKYKRYDNTSWQLLLDKSAYLLGENDDAPWEVDKAGFGRTFPHEYGKADGKNFGNYLTFSPAGDDLTLDFALNLFEAEELGQDDITDFLAISFSSTDYIGHIFGPSSLEAEDNILRLDRTLAKLFAFVDKKIGLKNTLIVLSADHGGPEAPGYLKSFGIDSGYVSPDKWDKEPSITALKKQFGIGQELILDFFPPYLYLNRKLIQEKGLDQGEVERAVAKELMAIKGVALAVSSVDMAENNLPDTNLNRSALANFCPKRSGDILVLFQPHYFINDFEGSIVAANHGGPWRYDSFVPIFFAGSSMKQGKIYREVSPENIAVTLAAIVGAKPPSGSHGAPLQEVMDDSM
jgi:predicted AlkP superfamily pyrophosphatase or phosphodiesterase